MTGKCRNGPVMNLIPPLLCLGSLAFVFVNEASAFTGSVLLHNGGIADDANAENHRVMRKRSIIEVKGKRVFLTNDMLKQLEREAEIEGDSHEEPDPDEIFISANEKPNFQEVSSTPANEANEKCQHHQVAECMIALLMLSLDVSYKDRLICPMDFATQCATKLGGNCIETDREFQANDFLEKFHSIVNEICSGFPEDNRTAAVNETTEDSVGEITTTEFGYTITAGESREDGFSEAPPDRMDLCKHKSLDAITHTQNGDIYVFKGEFYWKVVNKDIVDGYPKIIVDDWVGLEANLDAALTLSDGKTFFFKGGKYWMFTNRQMDRGYPKPISVGFPGVPDNLDTAFVWSGNGFPYFFKGGLYWAFDTKKNSTGTDYYPQPIIKWIGLPYNIDAAMMWKDNKTYFFKGSKYYRYNDGLDKVDTNPIYPPSSSINWFGCKSTSNRMEPSTMIYRNENEGGYTPREVPEMHESSEPLPVSGDVPDLCEHESLDAVTQIQKGSTYVFKGEFYWKVRKKPNAEGYPRKIVDDWDGLEANLDAAVTMSNGKTFFFKGEKYWRFTNRQMDCGYPKPISAGFPGIPDNIDAAFVWSGNGIPYFFKGNKYWKYDPNDNSRLISYYPKPLSKWRGLPNNINAAVQWENHQTYFFKGDRYYGYNNGLDKVDTYYPLSTSVNWFGCRCKYKRPESATTICRTENEGDNIFANVQEEDESPGLPPDEWNVPDICQHTSLDAVTQIQKGSTYVFKGEYYWTVLNEALADRYPRKITDDWVGLEANLDAALTLSSKTYFFKGQKYWRFTNRRMDRGYPKPISVGFPGIPDNLDAAVVWSGNGLPYFFKGDKYWRFDSNSYPPVSKDYPAPITKWKGLPNNIDAAVLWENNKDYFFKGDKYYRFDDGPNKVDTKTYPVQTAGPWFDC